MTTRNRSTDMVRRQAYNGKGLTFVEVIFDDDITTSATTPESNGSVFDLVTVSYTHLTLPTKA